MNDLKCVPLISYMKVDPEETRFVGGWDDRVTKLWTLVSYMEERQRRNRIPDDVNGGFKDNDQPPELTRKTAEFCVKVSGTPDFCGGLMFASPQIARFGGGGDWGTGTGFCHPGDCKSVNIGWEALDDDPNRAIDLAEYTGKATWKPGEIELYGRLCIAEACISELLGRGTRGWTCTDSLGGPMMKVHENMIARNDTLVPVGRALNVAGILDKTYSGQRALENLWTRRITMIDVSTPEWYNGNSGNMVRIMMGIVEYDGSHGGEGEYDYMNCPECGEGHDMSCCSSCHDCDYEFPVAGNDDTRHIYSGQVLSVLNNAAFVQQARRYDWSNG